MSNLGDLYSFETYETEMKEHARVFNSFDSFETETKGTPDFFTATNPINQ